ncbi:hypothetical protein WA538_004008, partial [Blastocystis sp. DL]
MESEEFAELLSHYPIIRPSDYIADCWTSLPTAVSNLSPSIDSSSHIVSEESGSTVVTCNDYLSQLHAYLLQSYSPSEATELLNGYYSSMKNLLQSYNLDDFEQLA